MFQSKILPILLLIVFLAACGPMEPAQTPEATELAVTDIPESTPTPEPFHLKLGIFGFASDAAFFIAQEEGYFAEQGLEVEFVRQEKASDIFPLLISGQMDVSTVAVMPGLFTAIAHDESLKIVAGKGYFDPEACTYSGLMVSTEMMSSGRLDDPANWVGLKIAEQRGSIIVYAIDLFLQQNGLSVDDVEIVDVPVPSRLDALTNGAIDVAGATEPWITRDNNSGSAVLWQGFNTILPGFPLGMIVYGPTILEDNPEVGQRFMVAYMKGVARYNEGKTPRNIAIISEYTQLAAEEVEQICWQVIRPDGEVDVQSVLAFQDWAFANSLVEETVTADQLYDTSFLEYAREYLR